MKTKTHTMDVNIQGMLNYYCHKKIPFGLIVDDEKPLSGKEARKLLKKWLKQGYKHLSEVA
jgi:hypothetical protein